MTERHRERVPPPASGLSDGLSEGPGVTHAVRAPHARRRLRSRGASEGLALGMALFER
ncbi:hypothetical protein ABT116_18630 [Streptomyces sp. NPDC002130]|uniref:hypothetical protein n=1 Tax=Streptomyces sp. NPDC002130 TaxID=3155568 RepID=UPI00332CB20B